MTDILMPPINKTLILEVDGHYWKGKLVDRGENVDWRRFSFEGYSVDMKPARWVEIPSMFDPRWKAGEPTVGHGVEVLVMGKCRDKLTYPFFCLEKNVPIMFPGFWNGPMRTFENVVAWMHIEELMQTAKRPPDELFDQPTMSEVIRRERARWMVEFVEMAQLAIVNDGQIYARLFGPLMDGRQVKFGRTQGSMQCWIDRTKKENLAKANGLLNAVVYHVRDWAFKNRNSWQSPYSEIDRGSINAAKDILEYYEREYRLRQSRVASV